MEEEKEFHKNNIKRFAFYLPGEADNSGNVSLAARSLA
jgi:hypothetical protein